LYIGLLSTEDLFFDKKADHVRKVFNHY